MSNHIETLDGAPPRIPVRTSAPRWARFTLAGAAALSAVTALPAIAALTSPLVPPNELQEIGYPIIGAPLGLAMVLIAVRLSIRSQSRWAPLLAATGGGWVVNALLVALRSWGVDGHLAHGPFVAATWLGQWSYLWPDVATFVLLPLALPAGRITGRWRIALAAIAASSLAQIVFGALGGGQMDDAALLNPVTGTALPGLIALRDDLYLPTMLAGIVLVLVRAFTLRRQVRATQAAALAGSVLALLAAEVAEGVLQGMAVPGYVPWLPAAVAVLGSTLLWARIAAEASSSR